MVYVYEIRDQPVVLARMGGGWSLAVEAICCLSNFLIIDCSPFQLRNIDKLPRALVAF